MPLPTNYLIEGSLKNRRNFVRNFGSFVFAIVARATPMGEAVAMETGDDVEVGVKNNLTGDGLVVHFDIDAVGSNRLFYGYGKFLHYDHHMGESVVGDIVEVGRVSFGDDKGVPDIHGVDV